MLTIKMFVVLAIFAAVCGLEVYLSRRPARWPGLVLPALWFVYTLFAVCAAVTGYYFAYETPLPFTIDLLVSFPLSIVQANIPAFGLLAVYFVCRSRRRRQKQLDRMQVQDL